MAPRARITPPSFLSKPERALFIEIVGSCDPRHFVVSDLSLLCAFVQAAMVTRAGPGEDVKGWEAAVKILAMLSTRLRLAPQTRTDPKKLARQQAKQTDLRQHNVPWEHRDRGA
jgi:hypothetical protein